MLNIVTRKFLPTFLSVIFICALISAAAPRGLAQNAPSADVVMVLSFENTSNRPEYNWVGESFADSVAEPAELAALRAENASRGHDVPEFQLVDTGALDGDRGRSSAGSSAPCSSVSSRSPASTIDPP